MPSFVSKGWYMLVFCAFGASKAWLYHLASFFSTWFYLSFPNQIRFLFLLLLETPLELEKPFLSRTNLYWVGQTSLELEQPLWRTPKTLCPVSSQPEDPSNEEMLIADIITLIKKKNRICAVQEELHEHKRWKWRERLIPDYRKSKGHVALPRSSNPTPSNDWGNMALQIQCQCWKLDSQGIDMVYEATHPPITTNHIFKGAIERQPTVLTSGL